MLSASKLTTTTLLVVLAFFGVSLCGLLLTIDVEWEAEICPAAGDVDHDDSLLQQQQQQLLCPSQYFSTNYFAARQQFRKKVKALAELLDKGRKQGIKDQTGGKPPTPPSVKLTQHTVYHDPILDQPLTIDVAIIPGSSSRSSSRSALVHISGTHGPEGYLGSAIQSALLDHHLKDVLDKERRKGGTKKKEAKKSDSEEEENQKKNGISSSDADGDGRLEVFSSTATIQGPTLILIHAVNPYGMLHYRRVNENNVDLNRNDWTAATWKEMESFRQSQANITSELGYVFNPSSSSSSSASKRQGTEEEIQSTTTTIWEEKALSLWHIFDLVTGTIRAILTAGFPAAKSALAQGQYNDRTGPMYGGTPWTNIGRVIVDTKEASYKILQEIIPRATADFSTVGVLDVHTGLGKKGRDVMIVNGPNAAPVYWAREAFKGLKHSDVTVQGVAVADGHHHHGGDDESSGGGGGVNKDIPANEILVGSHVGSSAGLMNHTQLILSQLLSPGLNKGGADTGVPTSPKENENENENLRKRQLAKKTVAFSVFQEFGTVPSVAVGLCLIMDNTVSNFFPFSFSQEWVQRRCNRPSFYPNDLRWRTETLDRGLDAVHTAARHLIRLSGDDDDDDHRKKGKP